MPIYTGFILQPTYRVREGQPVVQLFGRLESGEAFLVEDDRFRPYFFTPREHADRIAAAPDVEIEDTALCDLEGRPVVRVVVPIPAAVPRLREALAAAGGEALSADIRFPYLYRIDRGIRAGVAIDGTPETLPSGLLRFHDPGLEPAECRPALRILSLDLETTPDASQIYSVALVGAGAEEVHLVARERVPGAFVYDDERRLLAAAETRIRELDPDLLVGWNVVDFDLAVWSRRADALRLPAHLGRVEGTTRFQQDRGFTRQSRAEIPGRVVLDGIALVRDALRLEDYRLDTVARAVLGHGKLIDHDAPDAAAEISRLYREDPKALVEYNKEDARLVLQILEHEGLVDLAIERSLLSGMPLDRVGASIASFDMLYLPELHRRGIVAPSVHSDRKTELVTGGALLEPQPGVYANVAVFDFKSLYPSLIRTFNLDPLAHARADGDAITAPNGARFARHDAILPQLIERFMESRNEARRRGDRHADQAIKIMMNAFFGVLGAASCRFFDPEIANAITGFGQQILHWTRDIFEADGVRVLYGDTDSIFAKLSTDAASAAAEAEAAQLRARAEQTLSERIRTEYGVEPRLELELERIFDRILLPQVRGGPRGSKKRYAGWSDGKLEIVGLESVRRDWPAIARRLQEGMLERLFSDRDILPFVRELVQRLRAGELDRELVYAKRVRKGSLDRYTATTPPHIQAARKLAGVVPPVVRYVITRVGPEPVVPGRALPAQIDHAYYVEHVLRPIADAILPHTGRDFDEAIGKPHQLGLF
ncbi:MAG: DNA polymerase II [Deltaproteobacteria bacterium]|nr:MAG: DNA polymerase II [Deltaproteobacteria bacterium]